MVTDVQPLRDRFKQAHLQRGSELRLADHDQGKRRDGADLEAGQKPDLLQHVPLQQVGLIDHDDGSLLLALKEVPHRMLVLALGVALQVLGDDPELEQKLPVEITWF